MIGTFAAILLFTMVKEGFEDIGRHKYDRKMNHRKS